LGVHFKRFVKIMNRNWYVDPCVEDGTWTRDSSIRHNERTLYTLSLVLFRLILCGHSQGMFFRSMKSNIFHVLQAAVIRTHS